MKHGNANRIFGRTRNQRTALMRGLALSLIEHEKIQTTEAKARSLRPMIEKLITRGKSDSIHSRRLVAQTLGQPKNEMVKKLFEDISKRYADRNGGYTRVIKLGETKAGRKEAYIELV